MIYSPCYHGKHNIDNYAKMKKDMEENIESLWIGTDSSLDIYLNTLFDTELKHWFLQIFFSAYKNTGEKPLSFFFYHKDKKELRKARQLLRQLRLPYSDIKKFNDNYYIVSDTHKNG